MQDQKAFNESETARGRDEDTWRLRTRRLQWLSDDRDE